MGLVKFQKTKSQKKKKSGITSTDIWGQDLYLARSSFTYRSFKNLLLYIYARIQNVQSLQICKNSKIIALSEENSF